MIMLVGGFFFVVCLQPLAMVSVLVMMAFLCSWGLFYYLGGFWCGYLVLLVVVSGVLIVFVYMACLVPNESYEWMGLMFVGLVLIGSFCSYSLFMEGSGSGGLMLSLWGQTLSNVNLFMVVFLMGVMFMVVWFSSMNLGPIRAVCLNAWVKG